MTKKDMMQAVSIEQERLDTPECFEFSEDKMMENLYFLIKKIRYLEYDGEELITGDKYALLEIIKKYLEGKV